MKVKGRGIGTGSSQVYEKTRADNSNPFKDNTMMPSVQAHLTKEKKDFKAKTGLMPLRLNINLKGVNTEKQINFNDLHRPFWQLRSTKNLGSLRTKRPSLVFPDRIFRGRPRPSLLQARGRMIREGEALKNNNSSLSKHKSKVGTTNSNEIKRTSLEVRERPELTPIPVP